jgi:ATP adenylyltransferase
MVEKITTRFTQREGSLLRWGPNPSVPPVQALYAPWRIQYILGPKSAPDDVSLFTRIAQSSDDEENHVIARGRSCYALLTAYPYNAGHVMVVPYRQVADWSDLIDSELLELTRMTQRCQEALRNVMKPHGFNIGINLGKVAGAGIAEHLHIHLVPRWTGDTNFMPVIGQTAIIPEALKETASKLRLELTRQSPNADSPSRHSTDPDSHGH